MTNLPLTSKERKASQLPGGQIRQDEKHHLLDCLKGNVTNRLGTFLDVHGKFLDGPAIRFTLWFLEPVVPLVHMSTMCDEGTGHCHSKNRYRMGCLQVRQLEKCNEREERLWHSLLCFTLHKNSRQLARLSSRPRKQTGVILLLWREMCLWS